MPLHTTWEAQPLIPRQVNVAFSRKRAETRL